MASPNPRQRVVVLERGVAASLRESVDPAEHHHAGNVDRRKNRRTRRESEVRRIVLTENVGKELDFHTIRAGPQLVGERWIEHVRITQREKIAARRPEIPEAGQIIALQSGLRAFVVVRYEIAEHDVTRGEVVIDAAGKLI